MRLLVTVVLGILLFVARPVAAGEQVIGFDAFEIGPVSCPRRSSTSWSELSERCRQGATAMAVDLCGGEANPGTPWTIECESDPSGSRFSCQALFDCARW